MRIEYISSQVRIIKYMGADDCWDVVIERYGQAGTEPYSRWHREWSTDELSNDYAYSEAHARAVALAARLLHE